MDLQFIKSLFSLEGKVAVVTGASGYLGRTFAESLLAAGGKVLLFGRGARIKKTCDELQSKFGSKKVDYYAVDFYDDTKYRQCLLKAARSHKTIDILVNNAFEFSKETGFNTPSGKLESISKKQWMKSCEAGMYWHVLATQVIGEKMKSQKSGSIINISSMYGLVSPDPELYKGVKVFNPPSYSTIKAGMIAFTRYTASFYGAYNVRCNALAPGTFPNTDPLAFNSPGNKNFMKRLANKTVLKRVGTTKDLKGAIVFLASEASNYMTGQVLVVDGGWTIQ